MGILKRLFKRKKERPTVLQNVLNTSHDKHALLSYIRDVFEKEAGATDTTHTNKYTTALMAGFLDELGYNVDVIDWVDSFNGDLTRYSLVLGLGKSLEDILMSKHKDDYPKVVWFGTGCNPDFTNKVSFNRGKEFYFKTGRFLLSSLRYSVDNWTLQHELSDWLIIHGDRFCIDTYRKNNISSVLAPVFIYHSIFRSEENWQNAKLNYLWFGSRGGIHKGLDLCIEAFKNTPRLTLHICGDFQYEPEFMEIYNDTLTNSGNIKYHGYVDIKTEKYKAILASCAFTIFPSISEGNSPSVLTCMANGGLIPIVSLNADVNIEEYGIEIKECNKDFVIEAINKSQQLSINELKEQSTKIIAKTKECHTFDYFKTDFKNKLEEALLNIRA